MKRYWHIFSSVTFMHLKIYRLQGLEKYLSKNPCKITGNGTCAYNPSIDKTETGKFLGLNGCMGDSE